MQAMVDATLHELDGDASDEEEEEEGRYRCDGMKHEAHPHKKMRCWTPGRWGAQSESEEAYTVRGEVMGRGRR